LNFAFSKNGLKQVAPEGELTNRVKFQTVPASTKRERMSKPADSGKKSASRSGAFPFPTFFGIRGLAKRRGSTFFPVFKTFSTKRFPRNTERLFWVVLGYKGNVLRGCNFQKFGMIQLGSNK
jgi:hypothetical protein